MSRRSRQQGQSAATLDKIRGIGSALSVSTRIVGARFGGSGFTYWHLDTNAGCGWNELVDVPGSPLVFHSVADEYLRGMRREAFFCDIDRKAMFELKGRLVEHASWAECSRLIPGDNEEALSVFIECIRRSGENPRHVIGSVLVDPNGYWYRSCEGEGPPIRGIAQITHEFPKVDIILNINTRVGRLIRGNSWGQTCPEPRDVLRSLNKKYWLVKRTQAGGDEFLLAIGRNFETGDHRAVGLHHLESAEGREIMNIVTGGRQPELLLPSMLEERPNMAKAVDKYRVIIGADEPELVVPIQLDLFP